MKRAHREDPAGPNKRLNRCAEAHSGAVDNLVWWRIASRNSALSSDRAGSSSFAT